MTARLHQRRASRLLGMLGVVCLVALSLVSCGGQAEDLTLPPLDGWVSTEIEVGTLSHPSNIEEVDSSSGLNAREFNGDGLRVLVTWGEEAATPAGRAENVDRQSGEIASNPAELYSFSNPSEGNLPVASNGNWKVASITGSSSRSSSKTVVWVTYAATSDADLADRITRSFVPK